MSKGSYRNKDSQNKAEEPHATYSSKGGVVFFNSFEQMDEHTAKERAALSYEQRMHYAEILRKQMFSRFLLPDGSWPPIAREFQIMPPHTNGSGK